MNDTKLKRNHELVQINEDVKLVADRLNEARHKESMERYEILIIQKNDKIMDLSMKCANIENQLTVLDEGLDTTTHDELSIEYSRVTDTRARVADSQRRLNDASDDINDMMAKVSCGRVKAIADEAYGK
jgi:hypothetical protein